MKQQLQELNRSALENISDKQFQQTEIHTDGHEEATKVVFFFIDHDRP
jgi:hypothetical protein